MPAYNAAKHIGETLDSVLAQEYTNWEIIVVDDGSTDETEKIVAAYCSRDARIKYVYQENARQGRARNNGIACARGEYIAFLDADDLWMPEKLQIQVEEIERQQADLVFCDAYMFSAYLNINEAAIKSLPKMNTVRGIFSGDEGLMLFLENNRIPILTVLAKKTVITTAGGFTEHRAVQNAEDYHLWVKLLLEGFKLVGLDCTLAAYRRHSSSVSDSDGQNLKQVVEAKVDLAVAYPKHRKQIVASIRRSIVLSLEQVSKYSDHDFYVTVNRYMQISKKHLAQPLISLLQKVGARKLALRGTYFIFNYL